MQFGDGVWSHAVQFANLRFTFLRNSRKRRQSRALECAPRGRRQRREKSMRGLAHRLASRAARATGSLEEHVSVRTNLAYPAHTSFAYWMNPKFFATLSYSVRPGVLVVCVTQYTRLLPASFAIS
jgi:hypothetical protein